MQILITGGAGFIGSHLSERLLDAGHSVVALDDLSTGETANLAQSSEHATFRFVEGCVLDEPLIRELVNEADYVVHLAAAVGVRLIMEQPLRSFRVNTVGTENVVTACSELKKPLLLASTSEVYGKNTADRLTETSDRILGATTVKRWSYAASKAFDEMVALMVAEQNGLDVRITRFFNTVGPRQSPAYGMVVPSLAKKAVDGEAITVHGDGMQTRCFCHVEDTVEAVVRLIDHPGGQSEVFNIGRPEEVTILDLASRIRSAADSESLILTVPYDEAFGSGFEDMRRRVPAIDKINDFVGWTPKVTLDEIIQDAVQDARAMGDRAFSSV